MILFARQPVQDVAMEPQSIEMPTARGLAHVLNVRQPVHHVATEAPSSDIPTARGLIMALANVLLARQKAHHVATEPPSTDIPIARGLAHVLLHTILVLTTTVLAQITRAILAQAIRLHAAQTQVGIVYGVGSMQTMIAATVVAAIPLQPGMQQRSAMIPTITLTTITT